MACQIEESCRALLQSHVFPAGIRTTKHKSARSPASRKLFGRNSRADIRLHTTARRRTAQTQGTTCRGASDLDVEEHLGDNLALRGGATAATEEVAQHLRAASIENVRHCPACRAPGLAKYRFSCGGWHPSVGIAGLPSSKAGSSRRTTGRERQRRVRAELQSRRRGDGSPSKNGRGQGKNDHRAEHCGLRGPKSPSPRQANPSNRRKIGRTIMARTRPCAAVPGEGLGCVFPVLAPLCIFLWAPAPTLSINAPILGRSFGYILSERALHALLYMLLSTCSSPPSSYFQPILL